MKYAVGIIIFLWLLSGAIGASMMGDLDSAHWKEIVRGPVTLGKAVNDNPVSIPGAPD